MTPDKFRECFRRIKERDLPCGVHGLTPESKTYLVSLWKREIGIPFLFITSDESRAEEVYENLHSFLPEEELFLLSSSHYLRIFRKLEQNNILVITSLATLFQKISPSFFIKDILYLKKGEKIDRDFLLKKLVEKGYHFSSLVEEEGDYSYRGGIIDFYSPLYSYPIRIELFEEKIESIREFSPLTQSSIKKRKEVILSSIKDSSLNKEEDSIPLFNAFPSSFVFILDEPADFSSYFQEFKNLLKKPHLYLSSLPRRTSWMRPKRNFSFSSSFLTPYRGHLELLIQEIKKWRKEGYKITFLSPTEGQGSRLRDLLEERGIEISSINIQIGTLQRGFRFEETKEIYIADGDIFERYREKRKKWLKEEEIRIEDWSELQEGDYVVHIDHGIGIFKGIKTLTINGKKQDYFRVDYKNSDHLYIPVDKMDRLHKYIGDSDNPPPIYSLGGNRWEYRKKKVREATQKLASSLLKLYSSREVIPGFAFSPDTDWQIEFEASFPYEETPDQLKATAEIKKDMENNKPMERLVCGDAGYGKTEVAIRAAFKAVMDNKQVAVLVPTTILAEQHYRTFKERMAAYPIRIEMLSRFQNMSNQKKIIADLKIGKIDIIIGTHRLIQPDVNFKDLGLVIIDEEQRFGVIHKNYLRNLKKSVDVLTLSATPIPRSLYMSLMGLRKISLISTPPLERLNVESQVLEYNEEFIRKIILKELERGGQVFYLYNKIKDIERVAGKVKKIVPHASVAFAHGRMLSRELENTVRDFLRKKYDILVCTTIIESGIDMPNVNTLIVEGAENFGLADLYQLRGRVGRGKRKAFAYFIYSPRKFLTEEAKKRLKIINALKHPGSAFHIAMQDLEIRGAGNLLGKEQHGHISAIGFTLYSQLLSEEIEKLKGKKVSLPSPINLNLGIEARIPPSYVPYEEQRFQLYKRMGTIKTEEDILYFKERLRDQYGPLPREVRNLIKLLEIKLIGEKLGIISLVCKDSRIWARFSPSFSLTKERREKLKNNLKSQGYFLLPLDERNLVFEKKGEEEKCLSFIKEILQKLKDMLS
ncbi:transcription-repair coupling factor [Candidatus Aerophobetes bacterium]|nr:transcription-repair coupling factor [Candidatus Aerophobetes bacterium]